MTNHEWFLAKPYCGWLRNPAPPNGWLKPKQNHGINRLSTNAGFRNHPQYYFGGCPWYPSPVRNNSLSSAPVRPRPLRLKTLAS